MSKRIVLILAILSLGALGGGYWWGRSTSRAVPGFSAIGTAEAAEEDAVTPHVSTSMVTDTYESFFTADPEPAAITSTVISAVLPHHLLAGRYEANFFKMMRNQHPSVVVLIGPNHPQAGDHDIVSGEASWQTPYGLLSEDYVSVNNMARGPYSALTIDDSIIGKEHSIGAVVPFIKKTWPNTTIIPLIVKDKTTHAEIDQVLKYLVPSLPSDALVLTSVDFSHYLPESVANFHDELSENVLATGDESRLSKLEIDSEPSLYFLLEYNRLKHAESFHLVSHTNSASIAGQPDIAETTSHIIGYYTAGAPTEKPLISLQFFGDIMMDRNVAKVMGNQGLDYVFKNLHGQENRFFSGADLFIPNLEGPFAPTRIKTSKSIAFRFDPKWVTQLVKYGIRAVTLANNHSVDMGWANVDFTEKLLEKTGIHHFGREYKEGPEFNWVTNEAQGKATPPNLPLERGGSQASPPFQGGARGGLPSFAEPVSLPEPVAFVAFETVDHQIDKTKVLEALNDAKKKAKYVIAVVHGGTEYRRTSTVDQQNLYHWLIDNGAVAVIAHHPHVVEETEIYKGAPIVYSLGNFVFDQYFSVDTQQGLSVGLTLQDGKVKNLYFFPMQSVKSQDSLMKGAERQKFLDWMQKNSRLQSNTIQNGVINSIQ